MKNVTFRSISIVATLVFSVALLLFGCSLSLFGLGKSAETTPGSAEKASPPWFSADPVSCQVTETSAQSRGDPHAFDDQGKSTGLLPQGKVTCVLEIQACGDMIVKHQVVDTAAGESCPEYLHFSYAPNTKVCCASWNEAKVSKVPCDPLQDMDCDGIGNDEDEHPLDWLKP